MLERAATRLRVRSRRATIADSDATVRTTLVDIVIYRATVVPSMSLFERLLGLLGRTSEDAAYRCIQCGEGYERDRTECEACGSRFIAAVEDGEGSSEPRGPGGLP